MLSLMDAAVSLIVKVLRKRISLMCFRAHLKVQVRKNPTSLVVGVSVCREHFAKKTIAFAPQFTHQTIAKKSSSLII